MKMVRRPAALDHFRFFKDLDVEDVKIAQVKGLAANFSMHSMGFAKIATLRRGTATSRC